MDKAKPPLKQLCEFGVSAQQKRTVDIGLSGAPIAMRLILVAIFVFGFLIWDISQNDGRYSRQINGYLYDFARQVRWR